MKSIFVSRTKYGLECLEEIIRAGHIPEAVFSLKDEYKEKISDFGEFDDISKKAGIPLYKLDDIRFHREIFGKEYPPVFLRNGEIADKIAHIKPDIGLLLGFGEIIKSDLLEIPVLGWIGSHPTLLPKYRGGAPLVYPLLKGHSESGCTLMTLDREIDKGDIILQQPFSIDINDTATEVYNKMTATYRGMMPLLLEMIGYSLRENLSLPAKKQDMSKFIEYWPPRSPKDSELKFELPEGDGRTLNKWLHDQIRCVAGVYPPAFIVIDSEKKYMMAQRLAGPLPSKKEINGRTIKFLKSLYHPETDSLEIKNFEIK
jgi:methionyl-tRNA formyltransferase